jgi:lipopolysaccharide biosynthesis glycosyltransferase
MVRRVRRIQRARRSHPLEVACAADDNYLPHCGAMVASLLDKHRGQLRIHFLHGDELDSGEIERLSRMVIDAGGEIAALRIERTQLCGVDRFAPPASWYRVLLPQLLPNLERVLYLDADVIVTDSLRPLWAMDLDGNSLAATTTVFPSPEWGARHCRALGLKSTDLYFASGMLLMDLGRLREQGLPESVLDYVLSHGDSDRFADLEDWSEPPMQYVAAHPERLVFPDQDAMNALLAESRLRLHPRWNCTNQLIHSRLSSTVFGERERGEAMRNPAIRHFEGGALPRPWHDGGDPEGRDLYWRYRNRTPWALSGRAS